MFKGWTGFHGLSQFHVCPTFDGGVTLERGAILWYFGLITTRLVGR